MQCYQKNKNIKNQVKLYTVQRLAILSSKLETAAFFFLQTKKAEAQAQVDLNWTIHVSLAPRVQDFSNKDFSRQISVRKCRWSAHVEPLSFDEIHFEALILHKTNVDCLNYHWEMTLNKAEKLGQQLRVRLRHRGSCSSHLSGQLNWATQAKALWATALSSTALCSAYKAS